MKFSRVISRVRWFRFVETNVPKTISDLVLRMRTEMAGKASNRIRVLFYLKKSFNGIGYVASNGRSICK
jgi:hypothetical protein